jgi:hypothetical protein
MMQRSDLLSKFGPKAVTAAIDNVADYVGDVDEIGSSDVSGWVNEVERMLKDNPPEAFDEAQVNELSPATLKDYIKKAGSSSHERSASNLASRAADKLAHAMDGGVGDSGHDDDHKSFMRSKGIARAVDKLEELSPDTLKSYVKKASSDRAMRNLDQCVDSGTTFQDREPKFDWHNSRKDDQRRSGIHKALDRLEESGMSEADLLFQEIARGNVDIYDIYAHPKTNIEKFVSDQIHEKYEEVAREQGYHLDDDFEQILERIQRELEDEYGTYDNMDIEMETVGGGNWLEEKHKHDANDELVSDDDPFNFKGTMRDQEMNEGTALQGQYGHSGKMQTVKPQDADMMDRIKFLAGLTK